METIFIRRSVNGRSFAASSDPQFPGLENRKCPLTGEAFESQVKKVNADQSEIMGIDFEEAQKGVKAEGLFFGRFRINLGATMIIE